MVQNKNKVISLFIGNLSNVILHKILEIAIDDEIIRMQSKVELYEYWNLLDSKAL